MERGREHDPKTETLTNGLLEPSTKSESRTSTFYPRTNQETFPILPYTLSVTSHFRTPRPTTGHGRDPRDPWVMVDDSTGDSGRQDSVPGYHVSRRRLERCEERKLKV